MNETSQPKPAAAAHPLEILLELIRRARAAENAVALRFVAVNDSHLLAPFQQSALWFEDGGVQALSGLVEVDANAPYARWIGRVAETLAKTSTPPRAFGAADLPDELGREWQQWLPAHALWIPWHGHPAREMSQPASADHGRPAHATHAPAGGIVFARELPWRELDVRLFGEWMETWGAIYRAHTRPTMLGRLARAARRGPRAMAGKPVVWSLVLLAALLFPVRLSVLAPGELVPANPVAIRAPLDGVVQAFHVQTNEVVRAGQPLFSYEQTTLASRLEVAVEALRTAEAEERQYSQQALTEQKARAALASARGNVEERRVEVEFLRGQLERNKVVAPQAGVVFVDDPSEWIGRAVVAGERIMRIAEPTDKEIEAWLPVGDAIVLPPAAPVRLYLSASPLAPVAGRIRYESFDAFPRPEGHYAYRIRATIEGGTEHRVGLKGTVRLSGGRVPLVYWMLRRPIAAVREFFGV